MLNTTLRHVVMVMECVAVVVVGVHVLIWLLSYFSLLLTNESFDITGNGQNGCSTVTADLAELITSIN